MKFVDLLQVSKNKKDILAINIPDVHLASGFKDLIMQTIEHNITQLRFRKYHLSNYFKTDYFVMTMNPINVTSKNEVLFIITNRIQAHPYDEERKNLTLEVNEDYLIDPEKVAYIMELLDGVIHDFDFQLQYLLDKTN